FWSTLSPI
nr:Chain B, ELK1 peptide [Homo sapiens]5VVT_D Chain D, ELK1 peptide [Homo sapiens]